MKFEWDPEKARSNLAKHKIAFDVAEWVFDDPQAISEFDRVIDGEHRWRTIGWVGTATILFVVHTWIDDDGEIHVRIISPARPTDGRLKLMSEEKRDISADLAIIDAMSDDDIDYSDIPPTTDFSGFRRGVFYRPEKQPVTIRLDADVVDWFKRTEPKYQTAVNRVLREYMLANRKAG
jgi:hypothetical protein